MDKPLKSLTHGQCYLSSKILFENIFSSRISGEKKNMANQTTQVHLENGN